MLIHFTPETKLLDAAVYPSIIQARNICYSTIVLDQAYGNIDGVEYYEIETGLGTYKFAQNPSGILPQLLKELAEFRKQAKRNMARAKERGDVFMESVYNGSQLAYKVSMNSVYGFAGASKGFLPCVPIAASVTATGRAMIQQTKQLVESLIPGSRVVYGDSVAGYTPVVVRDSGGVHITTMERLAAADSVWDCSGDKEHLELAGMEVSPRAWCVCVLGVPVCVRVTRSVCSCGRRSGPTQGGRPWSASSATRLASPWCGC